jgi:chromosome segregation ATPase
MSLFRSDAGEEIYEKSRKKTIIKDGKTYKRVPSPKYQSRATRLANALSTIEDVKSQLEEIEFELDALELAEATPEKLAELKSKAEGAIGDLSTSDIEELRDEIEEWKSNLEGTNLENSEKYSALEECYDNLDQGISSLDEVSKDFGYCDKETLREGVEISMQDIDNAISEFDGVDFPGMFG